MKKTKWSIKEQGVFLRKTGELLSRGYPLSVAIHSLTYQMNKNLKEDIEGCIADLKEGIPFYEILQKLEFNKTLVGFVYFAEQHGSLADAFQEGSKMILKRNQNLEKLRKIIFYPAFLIIITFLLFLYVEKILLPEYSSLFITMNIQPNVFMKFVLRFSNILSLLTFSLLILLLLGIGYYYFNFRKQTPVRQKTLLSSLPFIGPYFRLFYTHYFTIQLSYLISGGLSIMEALNIFEQNERQGFDRQIGKEMKEQLLKGLELQVILRKYSFFETELPMIVKHGQENGKLDQELLFFSKYCLAMLEEKTEKTMKMIQPILYSGIGLIIVSIYLAILLPMFHLIEGI